MINVHTNSTEYFNLQEIHSDIARYFLSPSNCYISADGHLKRVVFSSEILPDWFLLNAPSPDFHGVRPTNMQISSIKIICFDFDGPPEEARTLATAFFQLCAQHDLTPPHLPLLNSGGGVHALVPIPEVENSFAVTWACQELYQEFAVLFRQAQAKTGIFTVKFDNTFDPARLFSLAGTRRVKDRTFVRHYFETPPMYVERFAPLAEKLKTIACAYVPFHIRAQKHLSLPTNAECIYEETYQALLHNIYRQKKCHLLLNRDGLPDRSRAFAILVDVFLSYLRKIGKSHSLAEKIVFACRHMINTIASGKRQLKYTYDLERQVYRLLEDFVWGDEVKTICKKKERQVNAPQQELQTLTLFLHKRLFYLPGASVPKTLIHTAFEQKTQIHLSPMQFGQLTTGKQGAYKEIVQHLQGHTVRCIQDYLLLETETITVEQEPEPTTVKEVEQVWTPVEWITPKRELVFTVHTLSFFIQSAEKRVQYDTFLHVFSLARAPPTSIQMR
jgi:hypothetical protein